MRFRRNADRLTAGQLSNLRAAFEAVYALADDRGYAHLAGIHGLPLPIGCDNAHGMPYFLPWHRAYLYFFERALRDRVERAMLSWCDWRTGPQRPAQVPRAFRSRSIDGQQNPLYSARVPRLALEQGRRAGLRVIARTRREPGDAALLPRADEVRRLLDCATSWTSRSRSRACTTGCTSGSEAIWAHQPAAHREEEEPKRRARLARWTEALSTLACRVPRRPPNRSRALRRRRVRARWRRGTVVLGKPRKGPRRCRSA